MEKSLLEVYKREFSSRMNEPNWAVHKTTPGHEHELIHCPIPFVGKYYHQEKTRILLYASAENLSDYCGKRQTYLDCDDYAVNRHRNSFNSSVLNPDVFFPNVHIQPINDGCLAIVALYVYLKFQSIGRVTPAEFLEKISFANYCKYTIQSAPSKPKNKDYAGNSSYLAESHVYVENDIKILKPDYIILPKTIYWTDRDFIDCVKGDTKIIPIYQINARNINLRIKNYPRASEQEISPEVMEWYTHLGSNGISWRTKENFLSVFSYLDDVMQNQMR